MALAETLLYIMSMKNTEEQERTHQVDGYTSSDEETTVDIHGMVFELDDASQTTDDRTHDEGKDQ